MQVRYYDGFTPRFNDFFRMRDELDQLFDIGLPLSNIRSVPRGTFPAINMQEGKEDVSIQAYLPGIDPKEIELTLEDSSLTIKGNRDIKLADEETNCHRRERFSGSFSRIVGLPEGMDAEKVQANYRDGILNISIGKAEEKKPKQISVSVE